MKIESDIKVFAPKTSRHRDIVAQAREAGPLRNNEELVDVRVAGNHRCRRRLNEVRNVRVREAAAKRPKDRRGESDVADQAKADEKDPRRVRPRSSPRQ